MAIITANLVNGYAKDSYSKKVAGVFGWAGKIEHNVVANIKIVDCRQRLCEGKNGEYYRIVFTCRVNERPVNITFSQYAIKNEDMASMWAVEKFFYPLTEQIYGIDNLPCFDPEDDEHATIVEFLEWLKSIYVGKSAQIVPYKSTKVNDDGEDEEYTNYCFDPAEFDKYTNC